jgi:hypothetical protein
MKISGHFCFPKSLLESNSRKRLLITIVLLGLKYRKKGFSILNFNNKMQEKTPFPFILLVLKKAKKGSFIITGKKTCLLGVFTPYRLWNYLDKKGIKYRLKLEYKKDFPIIL